MGTKKSDNIDGTKSWKHSKGRNTNGNNNINNDNRNKSKDNNNSNKDSNDSNSMLIITLTKSVIEE